MKSNSSRWGSASKSERDRLADLNDQYASMLGNILRREVTRDGDGVWWVNGKRLYDVYHKGGIVGGKGSLRDSEVMSVLEKGELVLDRAKKDSLYEYVDLSTYILKRFGSALNENSDLIKTSVMANSFDKLNRSVSNSVPEMNNSGSSYVVEKLEVNSPIQVIEKLDKTEIRRHARTIGEIAAGSIKEEFGQRGIRATSQQL